MLTLFKTVKKRYVKVLIYRITDNQSIKISRIGKDKAIFVNILVFPNQHFTIGKVNVEELHILNYKV